jgi:hypothetical protein
MGILKKSLNEFLFSTFLCSHKKNQISLHLVLEFNKARAKAGWTAQVKGVIYYFSDVFIQS